MKQLLLLSRIFYEKFELIEILSPFYGLEEQIIKSFHSVPHSIIKSESFTNLTHNISLAIQNINIPSQPLHTSVQMMANSIQTRNSFFASFFSNIENINISYESDVNGYIDLSETLANLVSDIDDSIELSKPNPEQIVRIRKADFDTYATVIGLLLAIITLVHGIYSSYSSTELRKKQHAELLQQNQQQHIESMEQRERHHIEFIENLSNILDSILNNTPTNDIDKRSPSESSEK